MDECLLGECGYTGQTCVNSVGSFECTCIPGFNHVDYAPGEDMCEGTELIKVESLTSHNMRLIFTYDYCWPRCNAPFIPLSFITCTTIVEKKSGGKKITPSV